MTASSMTLSRRHRFDVGAELRHADDASDSPPATVAALTLRVVGSAAFPTYTLADPSGALMHDVLCTIDLVAVQA